MKKLILTLLLFFSSIISFWYCGYLWTPDYTYSQVPSQDFWGLTNQAYWDDSFLCIETCSLQGSVWGINFMDNTRKPIFYLVNFNFDSTQSCNNSSVSNICFYVESTVLGFYYSVNNGNQYINMYQYVIGGGSTPSCVGSVFDISFIDTYNQTTNTYTYNLSDNSYNNVDISYNSRYDWFQTIYWGFAISPLQNTLECSTRLSNCQNSLNYYTWEFVSCSSSLSSCQDDLENYQYYYQTCSWERLDYINDLLECQDDLTTLSWSYNSCLWELNTCMSWNPWTWDIQWSALFINNIQHIWKPIINITIPQEINWDYTTTWDLFDLSVVWYNVDYDKIEWVINTQSTIPTKDDFNKIVSEVIPLFVPWLIIILFIYFVFRFIKKIF